MKVRKTDYSEIDPKYDEARSSWAIGLDDALAAIAKKKAPVLCIGYRMRNRQLHAGAGGAPVRVCPLGSAESILRVI